MTARTGIGDRYQRETRYSRDGIARADFDPHRREPPYKRYPDAETAIRLESPQPGDMPGADFWTCLAGRRSFREFSGKPLEFRQLSLLLFAMQGVTAARDGFLFRTAPSAGALYPLELYACVNRAAGLPSGIYHLNVPDWSLELLLRGDHGRKLASACLGQGMAQACAAAFILTALPGRSTWKYGQRAYRYIYLDSGHIGQNLYLAAAALGLGCCTIGAFFDDEVNAILGIDGSRETALYLGVVGEVL